MPSSLPASPLPSHLGCLGVVSARGVAFNSVSISNPITSANSIPHLSPTSSPSYANPTSYEPLPSSPLLSSFSTVSSPLFLSSHMEPSPLPPQPTFTSNVNNNIVTPCLVPSNVTQETNKIILPELGINMSRLDYEKFHTHQDWTFEQTRTLLQQIYKFGWQSTTMKKFIENKNGETSNLSKFTLKDLESRWNAIILKSNMNFETNYSNHLHKQTSNVIRDHLLNNSEVTKAKKRGENIELRLTQLLQEEEQKEINSPSKSKQSRFPVTHDDVDVSEDDLKPICITKKKASQKSKLIIDEESSSDERSEEDSEDDVENELDSEYQSKHEVDPDSRKGRMKKLEVIIGWRCRIVTLTEKKELDHVPQKSNDSNEYEDECKKIPFFSDIINPSKIIDSSPMPPWVTVDSSTDRMKLVLRRDKVRNIMNTTGTNLVDSSLSMKLAQNKIINSDNEALSFEYLIKLKDRPYLTCFWISAEAFNKIYDSKNPKVKYFQRNYIFQRNEEKEQEFESWNGIPCSVSNITIDRILYHQVVDDIDVDGNARTSTEFLVKWEGLNHDFATWERKNHIISLAYQFSKCNYDLTLWKDYCTSVYSMEELLQPIHNVDLKECYNFSQNYTKYIMYDNMETQAEEKEAQEIIPVIQHYYSFQHRPSLIPYIEVQGDKDNWYKGGAAPHLNVGMPSLYDYQIEGVNWLIKAWHSVKKNRILADEMGLGKTVQVMAYLTHLRDVEQVRGPFLIILPNEQLVSQWNSEIKKWTTLNPIIFDVNKGNDVKMIQYDFFYEKKCVEKMENSQSSKEFKDSDFKFNILLMSMNTFGRKHSKLITYREKYLEHIPWKAIFVDEGHDLRNSGTARYSGIKALIKRNKRSQLVLLTGTPIQNDVVQLFSLFHLIDSKRFTTEQAFIEEFGQWSSETSVEQKIELTNKVLDASKDYILRREKKDIPGMQISPIDDRVIYLPMTKTQQGYYDNFILRNFDDMETYMDGSDKLLSNQNKAMNSRHLCNIPWIISSYYECEAIDTLNKSEYIEAMKTCSVKISFLAALLPALYKKGKRVLIFSNFLEPLRYVGELLDFFNLKYCSLTGKMNHQQKIASLAQFRKSNIFAMLLTTQCGCVGLNLQEADTLIFFDSDPNPQMGEQAKGRCHRLGQTKQVQSFTLCTLRTYEHELLKRSIEKLSLHYTLSRNMRPKLEHADNKALAKLISEGPLASAQFNDENTAQVQDVVSHLNENNIFEFIDDNSYNIVHEEFGIKTSSVTFDFEKMKNMALLRIQQVKKDTICDLIVDFNDLKHRTQLTKLADDGQKQIIQRLHKGLGTRIWIVVEEYKEISKSIHSDTDAPANPVNNSCKLTAAELVGYKKDYSKLIELLRLAIDGAGKKTFQCSQGQLDFFNSSLPSIQNTLTFCEQSLKQVEKKKKIASCSPVVVKKEINSKKSTSTTSVNKVTPKSTPKKPVAKKELSGKPANVSSDKKKPLVVPGARISENKKAMIRQKEMREKREITEYFLSLQENNNTEQKVNNLKRKSEEEQDESHKKKKLNVIKKEK